MIKQRKVLKRGMIVATDRKKIGTAINKEVMM